MTLKHLTSLVYIRIFNIQSTDISTLIEYKLIAHNWYKETKNIQNFKM